MPPAIRPPISKRLQGLFALLLFAAWASSACSDSPPMQNLVRQAGQPCQDCFQCSSAFENCRCDTCTTSAYDPVKQELLACEHGSWVAIRECPGGVSAACVVKGSDPT